MGGDLRENERKLEFEARAGYPLARVAGVDEVGRGCLAGPVVAAAVCLPTKIDWARDAWLLEVDDSKVLTAETRARLATHIQAWAAASAVALATVEEIDRVNIYHASHLAMARAVAALADGVGTPVAPEHVLVDGNALPRALRVPATAVVKGDQRCLSIACASILAKVWRDQHMERLDAETPGYGLAAHKGYPTPAHKAALRRLGASVLHRRSFGPVRECLR